MSCMHDNVKINYLVNESISIRNVWTCLLTRFNDLNSRYFDQ